MKPVSLYSPEAAMGRLPRGALAPLLCIVLVALPDLSASAVLRHFGFVDAHEDPIGPLGFAAFLLLTFTLMGLVLLGWVRFVERRPLATIGLVGPHRIRTLLVGHAIGVAMILALVAAIRIAGGFEAGVPFHAFESPASLLAIAALLPCFSLQSGVEEMVFRGWLLSAIARKLNVPLAVLLSSATFTLLHYDHAQHWATTATSLLFAAFACAWALRSGNIWGIMGWHAGWNWLLAVGFELPVTGLSTGLPALLVKLSPMGSVVLTGGHQGPEGSVWCNVLLAAGIALVLSRPRRRLPAPVAGAEAVTIPSLSSPGD